MKEPSRFGLNLSRMRRSRGISQEALAATLGISRSRLGAYEECRNEPCHLLSYKIAKHFNVNLQDMIIKRLK